MILPLYVAWVSALIWITYLIDGDLLFHHRHPAVVTAIVMASLSILLPLLARLLRNDWLRMFKTTPKLLLAVCAFNVYFSYPVVYYKLHIAQEKAQAREPNPWSMDRRFP